MNFSAAAGHRGTPFERLEVIEDSAPHSGPLNMAIDEVLLEDLGETPALRIYRWSAPTVSFGCFAQAAPIRTAYPRWQLVRRWTGGGVVEHGLDTTYSLLVPRAHPFARQAVADTYQTIHQAVALALARVGWGTATLSSQEASPAPRASHACFTNPVRHDLMFDGRKIAGAAQRRTRFGLLHQGSIQGPAGMGGTEPADILGETLADELGRNRETRDLNAEQRAAARDLVASKYGTNRWLERF